MDSRAKSAAKAVTWRLSGFALTTAALWILTGRPALAASLGVLELVVKMAAYYAHERFWNRYDFGGTGRAGRTNA